MADAHARAALVARAIATLEKRNLATKARGDAQAVKQELQSAARTEQRVQREIPISRLVAEHSHNNHHGLPGANKYAHKGPSSKPKGRGRGRSARKKKK